MFNFMNWKNSLNFYNLINNQKVSALPTYLFSYYDTRTGKMGYHTVSYRISITKEIQLCVWPFFSTLYFGLILILPHQSKVNKCDLIWCFGFDYCFFCFVFFFLDSVLLQFSSVNFSHSVMSDSLRPHELQHARPPCPSSTPGIHSDSHPPSSDAIQPSHPLSSPSPPAPNPSQHQSLFQWVNSSKKMVEKENNFIIK